MIRPYVERMLRRVDPIGPHNPIKNEGQEIRNNDDKKSPLLYCRSLGGYAKKQVRKKLQRRSSLAVSVRACARCCHSRHAVTFNAALRATDVTDLIS